MTVDTGFWDTPIYDSLALEYVIEDHVPEDFKNRLDAAWDQMFFSGGSWNQGWNFAIEMIQDVLDNAGYQAAMGVDNMIGKFDSFGIHNVDHFANGYYAGVEYILHGNE